MLARHMIGMKMDADDEALARAAGQGDRAAFATLVGRRYDLLFRFCWRLTGAEDKAEDLAQEVCAKLPRALRSYRGDAKFTTWLYRVALNAARDEGRKAATRTKAMTAYATEPQAPPDDGADLHDWLAAAMARLKPDLRETAALVVGEGMGQRDAAEILGVTTGTVGWRMAEVKKALTAMAAEDEI